MMDEILGLGREFLIGLVVAALGFVGLILVVEKLRLNWRSAIPFAQVIISGLLVYYAVADGILLMIRGEGELWVLESAFFGANDAYAGIAICVGAARFFLGLSLIAFLLLDYLGLVLPIQRGGRLPNLVGGILLIISLVCYVLGIFIAWQSL